MKQVVLSAWLVLVALPSAGQAQEVKFLADTLTVEAEGKYEADPDLATLTFHVTAQEKELKRAYNQATDSMQRILQLAERKGVPKQDISTGTFTVRPIYDWHDRKLRARAYRVEGRVTLRVRDFARIGELIDESVENGIADFRSLTYSLADEEAAKQRAIALAMRQAEARARAAMGGNARRLGELRYVSVDVKQLAGIVQFEAPVETLAGAALALRAPALPSPPPVVPEKISVAATVQCVFQIL